MPIIITKERTPKPVVIQEATLFQRLPEGLDYDEVLVPATRVIRPRVIRWRLW